ncbi:hypothetical protein SEVIR_7G197401v4 [Setaria viridis]
MRAPHPPLPPRCLPAAAAAPTYLRRPSPEKQTPQSLRPPSSAIPHSKSTSEKFFSISPPPPPRGGWPSLLDEDWVPESPDLQANSPDLWLPLQDLRPASLNPPLAKRDAMLSYAEVVTRGQFISPTGPTFPRSREDGCTLARVRRSNSDDMMAPRRIQDLATSTARQAGP